MERLRKKEEGVLTLEACLSLTLFMFLILFLYSFFAIFEVQMHIHHTLLQTAQSMSLDKPAVDTFANDMNSLTDAFAALEFDAKLHHPEFVSKHDWSDYKNKYLFISTLKKRFYAYLTSGESAKVDEVLKRYRIRNGKEGLDFSDSSIDSKGNLNLRVTYTIEYLFDYKGFDLEPLKITNKVKSKIWSYD